MRHGLAFRTLGAVAAALLTFSFGAISASAASPTPSARFATYTTDDTTKKSGEVILPAGYPVGTITMVTTAPDGLQTSSTDPLNRGGFRDFLETDGAPSPISTTRHLSIRPADASNNSATVTIDFSSPIPAASMAINFGDVDVETIDVTMFDGEGTPVPINGMGFQETYNSSQETLSADPCASGVPPTGYSKPTNSLTPDVSNSFRLTGVTCDTIGASAWFLPSQEVKSIVVTSRYTVGNTGRYYLWFGASRPESIITPIVDSFTVGSDPIATPLAELSFADVIAVSDFPESDRSLAYTVADDGDTGCTITGTGPPEFSAIAAGSCEITATVADSADFIGATETFTILVTEATPPAPTTDPSPPSTPQQVAVTEPVEAVSGPELAATGAPAAPLWALAMGVLGMGLLVWARIRQRLSKDALPPQVAP